MPVMHTSSPRRVFAPSARARNTRPSAGGTRGFAALRAAVGRAIAQDRLPGVGRPRSPGVRPAASLVRPSPRSALTARQTLLLVARHPHLLAGAAAFDADTDLALRYRDFPLLRFGRFLQWAARREVGGPPWRDPHAYALRSPLDDARAIARSGVPLELWWSTRDRIVVDQARQSGLLYRSIVKLRPRSPVHAFVGTWSHTAEMRWNRCLPSALELFGLLRRGLRSPSSGYVHSGSSSIPTASAIRLM
jgi:hypothetical protein